MPKYLRTAIVIGVPLFVGLLNLTHPAVTAGSSVYHAVVHHLGWWLLLHMLNLVGFALLGLGVWLLVQHHAGVAGTISSVAIAVFVPFYVGFDALIGIGTGVLVQYASTRPQNQLPVLEPAISAYWASGMATILAAVGSIAWGLSMVGAAVALTAPRRRPATAALGLLPLAVTGWGVATNSAGTLVWWGVVALTALAMAAVSRHLPAMLLALAAMLFGTTHVAPLGPLGMACLAGAAVWLKLAGTPESAPREGRGAVVPGAARA
jgi:hypothetical protein